MAATNLVVVEQTLALNFKQTPLSNAVRMLARRGDELVENRKNLKSKVTFLQSPLAHFGASRIQEDCVSVVLYRWAFSLKVVYSFQVKKMR